MPDDSTRIHAWVTRWQAQVWAFRAGRSGVGASAGPRELFPWPLPQDGAARPSFPPLDPAVGKAVACELVAETTPPLGRQSRAEVPARAQAAVGQRLSRSTGWRLLATDAIKPWRDQSGILPRDPHVAEQAGPMLDWSAGPWQGKPLGPQDHILSADEKTSLHARLRGHPALPPAPGRSARLEHEAARGGARPYLVAWDVRRGDVMGRCEPPTGSEPCSRLGPPVLAQEPYRSGTRLCWIVDNGSSPRSDTAQLRRHQVASRRIRVPTPVHASGLKQVEISCSSIPRKVLTPHAVANLEAIPLRLAVYEELSNHRPTPLQWKLDRTELVTLLATIEAHQTLLSDAQSDGTEEAASSGHHVWNGALRCAIASR